MNDKPCPLCGGAGVVHVCDEYITHDMALDAGDPDMEGMLWQEVYDECPLCLGEGTLAAAIAHRLEGTGGQ